MKIEELKGQDAKIGKSSITVKDENGKTCGVITGVYEGQARQTSEVWGKYRRALNLEATSAISNTRWINGNPVFLANVNSKKELEQAEALKGEGIQIATYRKLA